MRHTESVAFTGKVVIRQFNADMQLVDEHVTHNLVVTSGKNWIANLIGAKSPAAMGYMAVGTGATAPAAGDTALGAELGRTTVSTPTVSGNQVTFSASFAPGNGTGAWQEAGLFNASSAGTMLARVTFGILTKGAGDTFQINWTITCN